MSAKRQLQQLPEWNPSIISLYDIEKSYFENAVQGPRYEGVLPQRPYPPKSQWIDFLGFKIASPIGVPAGPLLNSQWIGLAGRLGYDIPCYKTIRSHTYAGHSLPNVLFVKAEKQLLPNQLPSHLVTHKNSPSDLHELGITNSFGMPSRSPQYLQEDIPLANQSLADGQVLIVSVVGSPPKTENDPNFFDDFVAVAQMAKAWGAKIIEANFSCPNVSTGEGCIYYNPSVVYELSSKIVQAIGSTPLIIKMGIFPETATMEKSMLAAAKAGARGVSGINTISMKVIDKAGKNALGDDRPTSGVCGSPIREAALTFVQQARGLIDRHKLDLALIGCGGITLPEHFKAFLNAGADIAMTASGMMWDPYLALRYHRRQQ